MPTPVQDRPGSYVPTALRRNGQRCRTGQVRTPTRLRSPQGDYAALPPLRIEVLLLTALYAGYAAARTLVDQAPAQALRNGRAVLHVERLLGLDVERAAIDWLVQWTWLSVSASYAYAALHYVITLAVLVWLYVRHPPHYRLARSVLVATTSLALICYWALPTAPPRLLSDEYVDVLAATAPWGWWGAAASAPRGLASLTNQYAALPSMHVGWALWAGAAVALLAPRQPVRLVAAGYPLLVSVVVVVTGNHYVLDAVAGAVAVCVTALLYLRLERSHVVGRTGFGLIRRSTQRGPRAPRRRPARSSLPDRRPRPGKPSRDRAGRPPLGDRAGRAAAASVTERSTLLGAAGGGRAPRPA